MDTEIGESALGAERSGFTLYLPDGFIELPLSEIGSRHLQDLATHVANWFGLDPTEIDVSIAATAVMLASFGSAASAAQSSHSSAALFRSPGADRTIMVFVNCFILPSRHDTVETAISGLKEIHQHSAKGVVTTVDLNAGPAVTVETDEPASIRVHEQQFNIRQHSITAWIPDPTGSSMVALAVSSNNSSDWDHISDLARGIFDTFEWETTN